MASHRVKRTENWSSGLLLSVHKVILIQSQSEVIRYISEISNFQQPFVLKMTGRRAKRIKLLASGLST